MQRFEDIPLSRPQDRKYYKVELENPVIKTEFEGGFVASRPRHRRFPLRRKFTTGFTDLSYYDKQNLEQFWNEMKGGSTVFQWLDIHEHASAAFEARMPIGALSKAGYRRLVRFGEEPLKFEPKGYGPVLRYDVPNIILEEA